MFEMKFITNIGLNKMKMLYQKKMPEYC